MISFNLALIDWGILAGRCPSLFSSIWKVSTPHIYLTSVFNLMINFLTRYEIVLNGLLLKEDIYVDSEKKIGTKENSPEILFKDIINFLKY